MCNVADRRIQPLKRTTPAIVWMMAGFKYGDSRYRSVKHGEYLSEFDDHNHQFLVVPMPILSTRKISMETQF